MSDDKLTIPAFPDAVLHARRERGKAYAAQRDQARKYALEPTALRQYTVQNDPRQITLFSLFNKEPSA